MPIELEEEVANNPTRSYAHNLGKEAIEMASYQNEPIQMHSGGVGKSGYLKLRFAKRSNRSELIEMERRVPSLVQKALYWDEKMPQLPCVTMISTSGCLLQGDRQALDIIVGKDACAHVTTQSATKVHMMDANYAAQAQHIIVEENGYLELIPDQIIPHRNARFITDTFIQLHSTATVFYSEILQSGRKYHHQDELFGFDIFSSRIHAEYTNKMELNLSPNCHELFIEKYILTPKLNKLNKIGIMGGFDVYGNAILLTPKQYHEPILSQLQAEYNTDCNIAYGATQLPNNSGIIFKVLGVDTPKVKEAIRYFWQIARKEILGIDIPEPFLWR
ncbi:urease accessory protein UreD [Commensalibacter intestini]|uniref:urease accessory protein UreD n=1 Tax=Commensalibacter intestini TaxID=479936 RepID=UPI001C4EE756|nr:urease accessory protein UreD [Commensalibacter intestini]